MNYNIKILDDYKIPYIIIKKNYKRVTVKYNSNTVLEIRQPINFPDVRMIEFIEKHIDWILIHKPNRPIPHETYKNGDTYLFLGKEYRLVINYSNYEDVLLYDNEIVVHTASDKHVEKLLDKFRYDQAEIVFNEILYRSFTTMQEHLVKYPSLVIKSAKSRWGCCYINENKIMLNISLIHIPLSLIEYVIFHELVHFVHPNHSKDFHELLKKITKE
jgi:predicted metal-dependent hydrolase